MLRHILLILSIYFAVAVVAVVPQVSSVDDSSTPVWSRSAALPSNESYFANKKLKIACDANKFGRNLKVKSCRDMFGYLTPDEEQYAFALRDSGIPHDIGLPFRTYSSKSIGKEESDNLTMRGR